MRSLSAIEKQEPSWPTKAMSIFSGRTCRLLRRDAQSAALFADEIGTPFGITVDSKPSVKNSALRDTVSLREVIHEQTRPIKIDEHLVCE